MRPKLRPHAWSKTDHSANATRPRSLKPLPSSEFFNGIDPERTLRELSSIAPRSYIGLNEQLGAHQSFGERLVNHKEHFVETDRSEEHTSELQSLMRISYAVFCLKKK